MGVFPVQIRKEVLISRVRIPRLVVLLADAGLNDLEAWQFTESYREHQPDLAGGVLANMKGHLDYLSEENFVFSLASRRVRSEEKRDIVDHLLGRVCWSEVLACL